MELQKFKDDIEAVGLSYRDIAARYDPDFSVYGHASIEELVFHKPSSAEALASIFHWNASEEGFGYWSMMAVKLIERDVKNG